MDIVPPEMVTGGICFFQRKDLCCFGKERGDRSHDSNCTPGNRLDGNWAGVCGGRMSHVVSIGIDHEGHLDVSRVQEGGVREQEEHLRGEEVETDIEPVGTKVRPDPNITYATVGRKVQSRDGVETMQIFYSKLRRFKEGHSRYKDQQTRWGNALKTSNLAIPFEHESASEEQSPVHTRDGSGLESTNRFWGLQRMEGEQS